MTKLWYAFLELPPWQAIALITGAAAYLVAIALISMWLGYRSGYGAVHSIKIRVRLDNGEWQTCVVKAAVGDCVTVTDDTCEKIEIALS